MRPGIPAGNELLYCPLALADEFEDDDEEG
jgi:hypothetical protein